LLNSGDLSCARTGFPASRRSTGHISAVPTSELRSWTFIYGIVSLAGPFKPSGAVSPLQTSIRAELFAQF